jgi:ABC-type antimicrobial peptide transport system permease subunit
MSLGAESGQIQRMILAEGSLLLGLGLGLGLLGSLAATRLIQGLLYGVAPYDPMTLGTVAVLMAAIGIGACWLPARRAAKIDPNLAIRR